MQQADDGATGDRYVCLSEFRESVQLIYDRIQEARETRPAELAVSC